jgi:arylsulfatase A-like enzyme
VDRQDDQARRLVEYLQQADFTGVIFSRIPLKGTFPLETVRYNSKTNSGPDVLISLRWTADKNEYGAPGMFYSMDGAKGKGSHASLSRFDMNNTLVASGPNFKRGVVNESPTGNVDVGPTILHLLGVKPAKPMDGRVLREALAGENFTPKVKTERIEASHTNGFLRWTQYLKYSEVDGTVYFDEGNGGTSIR